MTFAQMLVAAWTRAPRNTRILQIDFLVLRIMDSIFDWDINKHSQITFCKCSKTEFLYRQIIGFRYNYQTIPLYFLKILNVCMDATVCPRCI